MEAQDDGLATAMAQANEVFGRVRAAVEAALRDAPGEPIDLLAVCRDAGLDLDGGVLDRLELPRLIYPLAWLPWHLWWPYEPLWCWWWRQNYPWYRCCPYMLVSHSRFTAATGRAA